MATAPGSSSAVADAGADVAEALSRSVARVHTVIAKDAGHYPAEESPDTVNGALIPFLRAA